MRNKMKQILSFIVMSSWISFLVFDALKDDLSSRATNRQKFTITSFNAKQCELSVLPVDRLPSGKESAVDLWFPYNPGVCDPSLYTVTVAPGSVVVTPTLTGYQLKFLVKKHDELSIAVASQANNSTADFKYLYVAGRSYWVVALEVITSVTAVLGALALLVNFRNKKFGKSIPEQSPQPVSGVDSRVLIPAPEVSVLQTPSQTPQESTPWKLWTDPIEFVTKIAALMAGLLYGVGLVMADVFYHSRNVPALSLARPSYILTGSWYLGPFFVAFAFWAMAHLLLTKMKVGGHLVAIPFGLVAVSFSIALIVGSGQLERGAGHTFGESTIQIVWLFLILTFFAGFFLGITYIAVKNARLRAPRTLSKLEKWGAIFGTLPFVAFAFAYYTSIFLTSLMPDLDEGLGGGKLENVRFLLKSASSEENGTASILIPSPCDPAFFGLSRGSQVSQPYSLIFADDKNFYVLVGPDSQTTWQTPYRRTLTIERSSVEGVVYGSSDNSEVGPDPDFQLSSEQECPRPEK